MTRESPATAIRQRAPIAIMVKQAERSFETNAWFLIASTSGNYSSRAPIRSAATDNMSA